MNSNIEYLKHILSHNWEYHKYISTLEDIASRFDNINSSIDVDLGWIPLVCNLHESIKEIDSNYRIIQIKQKFGSLRYYHSSKNGVGTQQYEKISKLIHNAENTASQLCEKCGHAGSLRTKRNWMQVLCDTHAK